MIENKKDIYRISMRLNPDDPVQAEVARILNTKGHHKSEFISTAIMAYIGGNAGSVINSGALPANEAVIQEQSIEKPKAPDEKIISNALDMIDGMGSMLF
jgi:hypothetical protein